MAFLNSDGIAQQIAAIHPHRVAVAYLGQDWPRYLTDLASLECIIISPTLGTSPHAVANLVKALGDGGAQGWDRVHFLDELHAKLYLGRTAFVVGSANLTANGLAGDRLIEAGLVSSDLPAWTQADQFFDQVLRCATDAYPTADSKRRRLKRLFHEQARAANRGLLEPGTDGRLRSILELADPLPPFHICWYTTDGPELKANAEEKVGFNISDTLHLHPDDSIEAGQWVLTWRINKGNQMHGRTAPSWMYVDHVQDGLVEVTPADEGYSYTKVALERFRSEAELEEKHASIPFHIDESFIEAMKTVLKTHPVLHEGLVQSQSDCNGDHWRLAKATEHVPLFVEIIQSLLRREARSSIR